MAFWPEILAAALVGVVAAWIANLAAARFSAVHEEGLAGLFAAPERPDLTPFIGFARNRTDHRATLAEAAGLIVPTAMVVRFSTDLPFDWPVLVAVGATILVLVAVTVDAANRILPDFATQPLAFIGLIAAALGTGLIEPLPATPASAALHPAALSIFGLYLGHFLVAAARRTAFILFGHTTLGRGDGKLMAAAGAVLGPFVLVDIFVGATILLALDDMLRRRGTADPERAFGPYLALAIWTVMLLDLPLLKLAIPSAPI